MVPLLSTIYSLATTQVTELRVHGAGKVQICIQAHIHIIPVKVMYQEKGHSKVVVLKYSLFFFFHLDNKTKVIVVLMSHMATVFVLPFSIYLMWIFKCKILDFFVFFQ